MAGLLDNYLDPAAAQRAGLFEGLTRFGAALAEAGRPRMILREGFGPGLLGGLAQGFGGFSQGMREGRQGALREQLANRQAAEAIRTDQAFNNLQTSGAIPEHLRPFLPAMDRSQAVGLLAADANQQRQNRELQQFLGGMGGGMSPATPQPMAPVETAGGTWLDRLQQDENSTGNPAARNPRSSATGNFQFIDGTWRQFAQANPALFQGMNEQQIMAARADPAMSRRAAEWYAQENAKALEASGLPATPANLALSHRFGPQGAMAILRGSPDAPVASVVPNGANVLMANPDLRGQTVGALLSQFQTRYGGGNATPVATTQTAAGGGAGGATTPTLQQVAMASASSNPAMQRWAAAWAPFVRQQERAADAPPTVYGNPQFGRDEQGNPVLLTLNNRGEIQRAQMPPGVSLEPPTREVNTGTEILTIDRGGQVVARRPINVRQREQEEAIGQSQGQASAAAGSVIPQVEYAMSLVDALKNHRAMTASTGLVGPVLSALPGTPMYDFRQRVAQLQGQNFLAAFESLRGGGAISNTEGEKAQQAIARLNQGLSERDFRQALDELTGILRTGLERAQQAQARGNLSRPNAPDAAALGPDVPVGQTNMRATPPPAPPRVGDVQQGFRFRGGNPADPNAWERVQ